MFRTVWEQKSGKGGFFPLSIYAGSADDLGILSIKLGSLDRHVQYQDLERGAGRDPKLFYMHFKPQA